MSLNQLATRVLLKGISDTEIQAAGWTYRKGKSIKDIQNAVTKATNVDRTYGKTEYEIDFLSAYLSSILKKIRPRNA